MADFNIKLTEAGLAALVDSNNIGTDALKITSIELGSAFYTPTGIEDDLTTLIKPLGTFGGVPADNGIIHITIRDESNDAYDLGEIGLRTGTGLLLGIVSSANGLITSKGANDVLLVSADLTMTESDITNITFGGADFVYRPGTEDNEGIFELATDAEVDASAANKVLDAAKFQSGITRRSSSDTNLDDANKLATSAAIYALSQLITANNSAIGSINTLLQSDNADLDKLQEIVDYIETIKGTQDTLAISNIAALQDTLDSKAPSHTHPYITLDSSATKTNIKDRTFSGYNPPIANLSMDITGFPLSHENRYEIAVRLQGKYANSAIDRTIKTHFRLPKSAIDDSSGETFSVWCYVDNNLAATSPVIEDKLYIKLDLVNGELIAHAYLCRVQSDGVTDPGIESMNVKLNIVG